MIHTRLEWWVEYNSMLSPTQYGCYRKGLGKGKALGTFFISGNFRKRNGFRGRVQLQRTGFAGLLPSCIYTHDIEQAIPPLSHLIQYLDD